MAYNELIKKFDKIREYMRRFYVYGFWHREQFSMKSAEAMTMNEDVWKAG